MYKIRGLYIQEKPVFVCCVGFIFVFTDSYHSPVRLTT